MHKIFPNLCTQTVNVYLCTVVAGDHMEKRSVCVCVHSLIINNIFYTKAELTFGLQPVFILCIGEETR
jgi:hypothetical protein